MQLQVASVLGIAVGCLLFVALSGGSYQPSVSLFAYLVLILAVTALVSFLYQAMIIAERIKRVIVVLTVGGTANLLLDWLFIPSLLVKGVILPFYIKEGLLLGGFILLFYLFKQQVLPQLMAKQQRRN